MEEARVEVDDGSMKSRRLAPGPFSFASAGHSPKQQTCDRAFAGRLKAGNVSWRRGPWAAEGHRVYDETARGAGPSWRVFQPFRLRKEARRTSSASIRTVREGGASGAIWASINSAAVLPISFRFIRTVVNGGSIMSTSGMSL